MNYALCKLGKLEEAAVKYTKAIKLCDTVLQYSPNNYEAMYDKASCYALQGNIELAVSNLKQAIKIYPQCIEWAKTDQDFDLIIQNELFQLLIAKKTD